MNTLGNFIWLIFGGILIALEYLVCSILLMITIIGIPFGLQTLKMANLALWPFGRDAVVVEKGAGCLSTIMNILWILLGGIWIALTHLFFAIILTLTIIGFPWARQHMKLAAIGLTPFGRDIRSIDISVPGT